MSNCHKICVCIHDDDDDVFILLVAFLFKRKHCPSNPVNPQPGTSMQNSEILSLYLFNYSVDPHRSQSATSVLPQYPHTSPSPVSSNAPVHLGEDGSSDDSFVPSLGSTARLQSLFFFASSVQILSLLFYVYLTKSDIWNIVISENKYFVTLACCRSLLWWHRQP
jgi:hypothetical protein